MHSGQTVGLRYVTPLMVNAHCVYFCESTCDSDDVALLQVET